MSRDASLRQRGGNRYSFGEHGGSVQGSKQGKFIIRNNLAQHWNPCWGDGVTVVRPLPQLNRDNPQQPYWEPYRTAAQPGYFGDWMRRYDAIRNFGDPGLTLLISDRADPLRPAPETTPAGVLYTAISQAVKNKQDQQGWAAMLLGGQNRGAQLTRPTEVCLFQCAVMQHKQEMYGPPKGFGDDKPVMMELSQQAGNAFVYELNQTNEGVQCPPDDWEHLYLNGDPVSLQYGRFVTFYRLSDGDPRTRQQQAAAGWNMGQGQHGHGQRSQDPIGFGCYLEPTFRGMQANLEQFASHIAEKVVPWDDLLWFPTIEEQANLIADRFPPDAILYGWRDHAEWIPESIKNRAVAQTVMTAPAVQGGWHGGWNPNGAPPPAGSLPPAGVVAGATAPAFAGGTGFGTPPGGYAQPAIPADQYAPPAVGYAPQPQQFAGQPTQFGGMPPAGYVAPQQQAIPTQPMAPMPPTGPTGGPPPQMQQFGAPQPQQFAQQPTQAPPQQQFAAPPQQFAAPPQQQFAAPPAQQFAQPPQQPMQAPQQQFAAPPQQQFAAPPQQQFAAPQQQAPPQQPMSWAGQANPAAMPGGQPSPMGQTPGGFATPPQQPMQAPQQQFAAPPQQGMPPQGPPPQQYVQQPAGGAPPSRAAAALMAAQNAAAVPQQ